MGIPSKNFEKSERNPRETQDWTEVTVISLREQSSRGLRMGRRLKATTNIEC
jgi:hypothetical protein